MTRIRINFILRDMKKNKLKVIPVDPEKLSATPGLEISSDMQPRFIFWDTPEGRFAIKNEDGTIEHLYTKKEINRIIKDNGFFI